jgi:hypothetical protein
MKRFFAAALSLLCVWTVARLVAQDTRDSAFDPLPVESADEPVPAEIDADPQADDARRDRFIEIMRAKAELMDDTELDAAIQRAEAEIKNLQASRLLSDARATLLELIETYPETPAAQAARRMLSLEVEPTLAPTNEPFYRDPSPSFTSPAESTGLDFRPVEEAPAFDEPTFPTPDN